ncbi:MAG: transglutaminase domain-containing protein [Fluviicola sp.]|nr:transglutaminase domain-containing protein [Fluviicola sp.]
MMQPSIRYCSKICLIPLLLLAQVVFAQPDSSETMVAPRLSRKIELNPVLLVEALTAGKTEDLEKFEAIFAWVASNIQYDYRKYFSGKGNSSETNIRRILRTKNAICFEYSALMDHLCALADIHNVTVTGYAKDQLFDINDTIYFDNHAWNAVQLDEQWYVYDVTWAGGGYEYRLRKFSQKVYNWRRNIHLNKTKLRKNVLVVRHPKNEFCNIPKHKEKKVRMVERLPLFWRIIDRVLSWIPLRAVIDHGKVKDKAFFLTEPRLFAITHFPNSPYWALTDEISNVREFSADKSYYDHNKDQYLTQDREGKMCLECDDFFALDSLGQFKEKAMQSLANNPRNGIEPAANYFHIAHIFYKEAYNTLDSLEKVSGYDSTVFYLDLARKELKRSHPQNKAYYKFHTSKDNDKVKQQRKANQLHTAVNITNVSNLRKRANKMESITPKIKSGQRTSKRNHRAQQRFRPKNPTAKQLKEETAEGIENRIDDAESKLDSMNERIDSLETDFLVRLNRLNDKVWEQGKLLRPQNYYFYRCANSRVQDSQDNRDKPIVEFRDSIQHYEDSLIVTVNNQVLLPSDTLYAQFIELSKLIKRRDAQQLKTLKLYARLYTGNIIGRDSVEAVRSRFLELTKKDYCYFFKHRLPILDFAAGYEVFRNLHYELYAAIKLDNKAELMRHKAFVKEISLTKKRAAHVIGNNLRYQAKYKRKVMNDKREYIRKRKEENKKIRE